MNVEMDKTERRSKEQYMLDRFGKMSLETDTGSDKTRKKKPVRKKVSPKKTTTPEVKAQEDMEK